MTQSLGAHSGTIASFVDAQAVFPASLAQLRVWREQQADPGGSARNIAACWRLDGPVDPQKVRAACEILASRHESLRTRFALTGGCLMQEVLATHRPAFGSVDLSCFVAEERDARAMSIGRNEARTAFDLDAGPPWRVTLLALGANRSMLLVSLHSIIADGWSIGVFARDLGASIAALSQGTFPLLEDLPLQFVDFALWQSEYIASSAFLDDHAYWLAQEACPAALLPRFGLAAPDGGVGDSPILSVLLPQSLTMRLDDECKLAGVSTFSAAAAGLALVLRARTESDRIVIGTQVAGRDAVELEGLIGPIANTLLLSFDTSGQPTLRGLLRRVGIRVREALAHQTAPFEAIMANNAEIASVSPKHQVNLILQKSFVENADYGDIRLTDQPSHSTGPLYDFSFFMIWRPEGWRISCEYDPKHASPETAVALLESWRSALDTLSREPNLRLVDLEDDLCMKHGQAVTFPCTPPQLRCWFLDQLDPGSAALNVPVMWELRGPVAPGHVEQALQAIIARHEILRTGLVAHDTVPIQTPLGRVCFKLQRADLSHLAGEAQKASVEDLRRALAGVPFDLAHPPLMRALLLRASSTRAYLVVVFHQSVFDGWSIRLFANELGAHLQALREDRSPDLPALLMQYGEASTLQEARLASDAFKLNASYWRDQLREAPYFEVSPDFQRPRYRTTQCETVSSQLPPQTATRLELVAQSLGVTTFVFGCASVSTLLHAFTGKCDIVIGTQAAGRGEVEVEPLIGVFINNLVLRFRPQPEGSFLDCLKDTDECVRGALEHQEMPFDRLVELLNPPRDTSRMPLIAINVVVRHAFLETARFGEIELVAAPVAPANALYDLSFELIGDPAGWRLSIEFNRALYERATANRLLNLWQSLLQAVISDPHVRIADLASEERRPALAATDPEVPAVRTLEARLLASAMVEEVVVWADKRNTGEVIYRAFVTPRPDLTISLERLPNLLLTALSQGGPDREVLPTISVVLRLPKSPAQAFAAQSDADLPATSATIPACILPDARQMEAEQTVGAIWASLLRVDEVAPDDNFFELGGYSLLALRMLAAVKQNTVRVPKVSDLFREPTLRGFTQLICEAADPADITEFQARSTEAAGALPGTVGLKAKVIAIQPDGDRTPIIALNNTVIYYNLARKIGVDRPFIGIQMFDPEAPRPMVQQSLESIAADFVGAIRSVRPRGPYILLGLCVSGAIALEVAQQLHNEGEEVPLIIQADASAPNYLRNAPFLFRSAHRILYRFRVLAHHVARVSSGKRSVAAVLGSYEIFHRVGLTPLAVRLGLVKQADLGERWRNLWFQPFLEQARLAYQPRPYAGDVAIFLSDEVGTTFLDRSLGWREKVQGRLVIARAPGWHAEMFSGRGAEIIAETLAPMLSAIDRKAGVR